MAEIAARVLPLLDDTDGTELVTTVAGGMRLADYLPTRVFELVVHTLDLAAALGLRAEPNPHIGTGMPFAMEVSSLIRSADIIDAIAAIAVAVLDVHRPRGGFHFPHAGLVGPIDLWSGRTCAISAFAPLAMHQ